jgi:hypothetical protein
MQCNFITIEEPQDIENGEDCDEMEDNNEILPVHTWWLGGLVR